MAHQCEKLAAGTCGILGEFLCRSQFHLSPAPLRDVDANADETGAITTSALGMRDTETKCVRPSEINRFFGGLSTRRWQCTYPVREVGNGNARFEGTCQDRKGRRVNVRLRGPYAPESFRFNGGAQLARGTPYIPASITARRIAAQCPANAEYF